MNIFWNPEILSFATDLAKKEHIWYVDYNDSLSGRNYDEIKDFIYNDDSIEYYDFWQEETDSSNNILKRIIEEFPAIKDKLNETEDDENKDLAIDDLRDLVQQHATYEDIQAWVLKNSGSAWFNIELPYYREAFDAVIESWKCNWMKVSEQYIELIKYCAKKMWIRDYAQFAKKSVENIEININLDYSPLYYDDALAFYTRIELTDYFKIAISGEKFALKLDRRTWFGITSDGGACEDIDREDIVIDVIQFEWDRFLTICDWSENITKENDKSRVYHIQGAYFDRFYGDELCWLSRNAHWKVIIEKK